MVMIFGEITTKAHVQYEKVIRDTIKQIGYDDPAKGLDFKTVNVNRCHRGAVARYRPVG
ncbi:hypothetical protein PINS_up024510 [Pythium insidiosum]|nr:hypothetical protein PINS_up024510 [Pythium insidiosum]